MQIYIYTKTQFDFAVCILIIVIIYSRLLCGERMKESYDSYSCHTIDASLLFCAHNFPHIYVFVGVRTLSHSRFVCIQWIFSRQ